MPASRSPARSANSTLYQGSPTVGLNGSDAQCGSSPPSHAAPQPASPPTKRRRTPNAFILYRSYIFAEKKFPPELTHQNDISRYAAMLWERLCEAERSVFFQMAEDMKLRAELESPSTTPHKKRRSKPGKTNNSRADSLYAQSNTAESSASDTGSPMLPVLDTFTTVSGSRLNFPAPTFDHFALALHDAFTPPKAPQAIHAIPPSLLNWGLDMENSKTDTVEPDPSSSACAPLLSYQSDHNCFGSLDMSMQDFALSLGMNMSSWPVDFSLDPTTKFLQPPPFGNHLPM